MCADKKFDSGATPVSESIYLIPYLSSGNTGSISPMCVSRSPVLGASVNSVVMCLSVFSMEFDRGSLTSGCFAAIDWLVAVSQLVSTQPYCSVAAGADVFLPPCR